MGAFQGIMHQLIWLVDNQAFVEWYKIHQILYDGKDVIQFLEDTLPFKQDWSFLRGIAVSISGAVFWFLLGSVTTVALGVKAIQTFIANITTQFCEALPFFCDLLGTGM